MNNIVFYKGLIQKLLLLLAVSSTFNNAYSQKNIEIVTNSKSKYSIAVASNATDIERKAANTLQKYITEVTKCVLPIVTTQATNAGYYIAVGRAAKATKNDTAGLGDDGILIKQANNTLIITGGPRKGVLYSVFAFLEDYVGCQAYTVADVFVPRKNSIVLAGNLFKKQIPSFDYRMTYFPDALSYDYCDWRKLNYMYEDWGLWVHSFAGLLPKEQFFETHPEFYALINGKRSATQPDLTNPEVLRIVVEHLKVIIAAKPGAKYWSVSQNDNPDYCQCVNCTRLNEQQKSPQGALLTFVNAVARNFPDKIITTLAYGYSEKPPLTLKPEKNVMIMLTNISPKSRSIPIAKNPSAVFNQNLKKWRIIANRLFVWDYVVQFENAFLPFPNIQALQPNIQYFAQNKVQYLFEQGIGDIRGEFSELKCYIISKLMWNKDINLKATTDSFLNHYYGNTGAIYIKQYITELEESVANGNVPIHINGDITPIFQAHLSAPKVSDYKNIFKNAFKVVDSNSEYGKRIMKEYVSVLYGELELNRFLLKTRKQIASTNEARYLNVLEDWYKKMKFLNLTYLSESKMDVNNYYREYMKMLKSK